MGRASAGLTAALLVSGLATGCGEMNQGAEDRGPRASTSQAGFNGIDPVPPGTPCPGAVHGGVKQIAAVSESPVYLPSTGSDGVTEAWRCGDTPIFMFGDVQLSFESGWSEVPVPKKLEDLADDYGGSVQEINGLSAWVVSHENDEVLMIKGDTAIRLLARGNVPIEQLVDLAESLDLSHAVS